MKKNLPVTEVEQTFDDSVNILSTTDLKGSITYVNQDFLNISGFSADELMYKNHNVVRHPDMPPAAFANLWDTLKAEKPWMGIVKNRCKNGDHYWVNAFVMPIKKAGTIIEYQSVRNKPEQADLKRAEKLYQQVNAGKLPLKLRYPQPCISIKAGGVFFLALLPWMIAGFSGIALTPVTTLALTALSGIIAGFGIPFANRNVRRLARTAKDIIDNPLLQEVYTGEHDEAGKILLAMKMLKTEINAISGRIMDSSLHLRDAAKELDDSVALTNKGVVHQNNEIASLTGSIADLSTSAEQVMMNSQQALETSTAASNSADNGQQVISNTVKTIQALAGQVEKSAEIINKLDQESQHIGGILDVIMNIAEQTNLLALNAAIEAARAGDQGRGFAVVADEVRSLANRTHASIKEIEEMISRLQAGAREAVENMNNGKEQANAAVDQAAEAGASLCEIISAVSDIRGMNQQIADSSGGQSQLVSTINDNVEMVTEISELTVETLDGQNKISVKMDELSDLLYELSSQFMVKKNIKLHNSTKCKD
ncbi:MAG: methyl-accepting chemotaxis protein [Gammaproteobacteria bacterium]|nr:methyl-accepting chemotaxis protein [Gammaproteobacteria bacterium]